MQIFTSPLRRGPCAMTCFQSSTSPAHLDIGMSHCTPLSWKPNWCFHRVASSGHIRSSFHLQILLFSLGMYASVAPLCVRMKNREHGRGVRGEQAPRHANDDVNTANVDFLGNGGGSIVTCPGEIVNDTDASLVTLADAKPERWKPKTQPAVQLNLRKKRNELSLVKINFGGHRDLVVPCTMLARMLRELRHRDANDRARSRCCGAKWSVGFNSPHKTFGNCVGSSAPAKPESMKNSFNNNNRRFSSRAFTKTCETLTKWVTTTAQENRIL